MCLRASLLGFTEGEADSACRWSGFSRRATPCGPPSRRDGLRGVRRKWARRRSGSGVSEPDLVESILVFTWRRKRDHLAGNIKKRRAVDLLSLSKAGLETL